MNVDLSTCDREPIHIPGSVQPHGVLLALTHPDLVVVQASENAPSVLGLPLDQILGARMDGILPAGDALAREILDNAGNRTPVYLRAVHTSESCYQALVHRSGDLLVLELERSDVETELTFKHLQPLVWKFVTTLAEVGTLPELMQVAAAEVRSITGFDRALVYRFDEDWNGTVVAEDRNERLPSYLDLRFPASDIPAQARELYRINRLRLIADASYTPVPLVAASAQWAAPIDLSHSVLRSVSPIHLEYMRNMGTAASMSISILHEGRLWGLISCHHATPRHVGFELRSACDLIGQVFALQLAGKMHAELFESRLRSKTTQSQLLALMAGEETFIDGLVREPGSLLSLVGAHGAAVLFGGNCVVVGATPDEAQVRSLCDWLAESGASELYSTDSLSAAFPQAIDYVDRASGLLAISISKLHRSYVLWFRPEVVQTVKWGGDPRKPVDPAPDQMRLHPRKSFEMWKETVQRKSNPWSAADLEAAADLRNAIVGIVLRNAEELAEISAELERSNRELESFSYSVSHDLRAPFRHIVGYAELLRDADAGTLSPTGSRYVATIIESAQYAGTLVDNLLNFSQIGRSTLLRTPVDMNVVVREVLKRMAPDLKGRKIDWRVQPLPAVEGDSTLLRMAVANLLSNAVKYTRRREEAVIEIGSILEEKEVVFFVRDNGVGFEMAYIDKLFGVFQRLHKMEDFEGTGIGLANVRRIVSRHGGRTWAEGAVGQGATFFFSLPRAREGEPK